MEISNEIIFAFFGTEETAQIEVIENGIINSTYKITLDKAQFIVQNININVFKDPLNTTFNIEKIAQHFLQSNYPYTVLTPVKTTSNALVFEYNGAFWRAFKWINGVPVSGEKTKNIGRHTGKAFGKFIYHLNDFQDKNIVPSIPDFLNFNKRFADFKRSIQLNSSQRLTGIQEEVRFLVDHFYLVINLERIIHDCPKRLIHCDTKLSNILFDKEKNEPIAVIDLDTAMYGPLFFDYSDLIRSFAATTVEDDPEIEKVSLNWDLFSAVTQGFISEVSEILTTSEWKALKEGVAFSTYIQCIRFFTDYLNGDTYYSIDYPDHNLIRGKNQLKLFQEILAKKHQIANYIDLFKKN